MKDKIVEHFKKRIEIDTRSLAVFRILLGLIITLDIFLRLRSFQVFYTAQGAVPRQLAIDLVGSNVFSLYFISDHVFFVGLFMALQVIFGIFLIFGYRTRISSVIAFFLLVSLANRNTLITSYADTLLALMAFWAIFLPLGERWSIDSIKSKIGPRKNIASLASGLIMLQVIAMYFVNGIKKTRSDLWISGDAVPIIIGHDSITFLAGNFLRQFPELLRLGGNIWMYMLLFSFMLFVFVGKLRMIYAALFMGAHALLAVSVRIGSFSYVCIAALMLFMQADFWKLANKVPINFKQYVSSRKHWIIGFFDAVDRNIPKLDFEDVFIDREQFLRVISLLSYLVLILAGTHLVITTLDAAAIAESPRNRFENTLWTSFNTFGIEQPEWGIFAPAPSSSDQYYVFAVETMNGTKLDIWNDRPLSFERPGKDLNNQWPTYRYRFFIPENLRNDEISSNYLRYLCTYWNEDGMFIEYINIYGIEETVTFDTIDTPEERNYNRTLITRHACDPRNDPKDILVD